MTIKNTPPAQNGGAGGIFPSDKNESRPEGSYGPSKPKVPLQLQLTSFVSGATVMVLELSGSRLIAPFFGTSLIVWTSLIGVIMVSLCIGNTFGGHLADHSCADGKGPRVLGRILAAAAAVVALTTYGANPGLTKLSELGQNLYATSLLASVVIFAPSSILLGMVSPFITRLALDAITEHSTADRSLSGSGATVGQLSALNSLGSILGTFLGGFVLISLFPSSMILMGVAVTLAVLSFLVYSAAWHGALAFALTAGMTWYAATNGLPGSPIGVQLDTAYNHISIVESTLHDKSGPRRVRIMMTDPEGAQSLMFTDAPNDLVSDYTKFYDLAWHFSPNAKRILMLGGGGYCVPRHVLTTRPDVTIDVVELDPGITSAAQAYFNLTQEFTESGRLKIYHEDARTFVNRGVRDALGPYDAIFMDVFGSWYSIPFQMTTIEAAKKVRDLLTPDGVLIMNVIASVEGPRSGAFHGIYSAFATAFPTMKIYPASAPDVRYAYSLQNLMLVALCEKKPVLGNSNQSEQPESDSNPEIVRLLTHEWSEPFTPRVTAFTDEFAPVERYAILASI